MNTDEFGGGCMVPERKRQSGAHPIAQGDRVGSYQVSGLVLRGDDVVVRLGEGASLRLVPAPDQTSHMTLLRDITASGERPHPNVVALREAILLDGQLALVMDAVDGPSLSMLLASRPPEPSQVDDIARQLLGALAHAHAADRVHGQLALRHVLLEVRGTRVVVRLSGFGLAIALESLKAHDLSVDVTGAARILYELLVGQPPPSRASREELREAMAEAPARMRHAIIAALDPDAMFRPQDAGELLELWTDETTAPSGDWDAEGVQMLLDLQPAIVDAPAPAATPLPSRLQLVPVPPSESRATPSRYNSIGPSPSAAGLPGGSQAKQSAVDAVRPSARSASMSRSPSTDPPRPRLPAIRLPQSTAMVLLGLAVMVAAPVVAVVLALWSGPAPAEEQVAESVERPAALAAPRRRPSVPSPDTVVHVSGAPGAKLVDRRGQSHEPGDVAPGSYWLYASFGGQAPQRVMRVTVEQGQTLKISCDPAAGRCQ